MTLMQLKNISEKQIHTYLTGTWKSKIILTWKPNYTHLEPEKVKLYLPENQIILTWPETWKSKIILTWKTKLFLPGT